MNHSNDTSQRFLFTELNARGEWVRLNKSYQKALSQHSYPELVQLLIGEVMVAVSLLSATLKFEGTISLQIKTQSEDKGPLSLLMAESTHDRKVRAMARYDESDDLFQQAAHHSELIQDAQLVITISPKKGRQYQGIVAIEQGNIAQCLENYFANSEQLNSRIWIFVDHNQAGGLILQYIPQAQKSVSKSLLEDIHDESEPDAWTRLGMLADTLTKQEMFNEANEVLLKKLFSEDDIQLFDSKAVVFECSCSLERSQQMLVSLGYQEVQKILQESPEIKIDCQFCHAQYRFVESDIEALFFSEHMDSSTQTLH